jgi:hypothetical protein
MAPSLDNVSTDFILSVGEVCINPVDPKTLVHFAATSRAMLVTLRPKLAQLREFRAGVQVLCRKSSIHLHSLAEASQPSWSSRGLTLTDFAVLGRLLQRGLLPCLRELRLGDRQIDHQCVAALVQGLGKGVENARALQEIQLWGNTISDAGMKALSEAAARGGLASVKMLALQQNLISDPGMIEFASAISRGGLPNLSILNLQKNGISDQGMASFSDAMSGGSVPKLQTLFLDNNNIGDAGMIAFAEALKSQRMPALMIASFNGNPGDVAPVKHAFDETANSRGDALSMLIGL